METNCLETNSSGDEKLWRQKVVERNSSGDELLKTSSKDTNCLETKSRGTHFLPPLLELSNFFLHVKDHTLRDNVA